LKPEPYLAPPPRALTDDEILMLRASASGGAHPLRPVGIGQWRTARKLEEMGLGAVEGSRFTATARGVAAVSDCLA
jgi:hypothetical protein